MEGCKEMENQNIQFLVEDFINEKVLEIMSVVQDGLVINALSGGVDSSVVTMLGHRALGDKLRTYFIDNGLMREGEPQRVVSLFRKLGVLVELIDAQTEFFRVLKDVTDPEEKREVITQTFYKKVFSQLIKNTGAKHLLQGTILTDIDETVTGIKRQHNVFEQIGINPEKVFGYKIIEPLVELRKPAVRIVAKVLGLPKEVYNRIPFPGPALAARVIGEATPERIEIIRKATKIVEEELAYTNAFQYLAILHEDKVTGIRDGKREFGYQVDVRCWDSIDARVATPTRLPYDVLWRIADRITAEVPGVVHTAYGVTKKPASTIEVV